MIETITRFIFCFCLLVFIIIFSTNFVEAGSFEIKNLPGPEIMPDSPFYFLKIWYEKIITFFNFNDLNKAERYSELAERRLYEAERMAKKGKTDLVEKLIESYNKFINKAIQKIEKVRQQGQKEANQGLTKELGKISRSVLQNQESLLDLYKVVPEDVKNAIEKSFKITKIGYDKLIESLSGFQKEELIKKAEEIKNKAQQIFKDWREIFGP